MHIVFLVIISFLVFAKGKAEIYATEVDVVLNLCCELGVQFSSNTQKCSTSSISIPREIHQSLHNLCRSNIEFCCQNHRKELNCREGQQLARLYSSCSDRSQSEMFQICCNACKVGQQTAVVGGKCIQPLLGSISDKAKHDCCLLNYDFKEETDENLTVEDEDLEEAADYDMMTCQDHDCSHKCENKNGSATCVCGNGFYLADDKRTCVTIVADPIRRDDCKNGFKINFQGECEDIDECSQSKHTCHELETCINNHGSFTCKINDDCDEGFRFNIDIMKCEDVDECKSDKNCLPTEVCVNNQGSYDCRLKTCQFGFKLNYSTGNCDDVDECKQNQHCGRNMHCVNTVGSFQCECNHGFRNDFYEKSFCVDVDECNVPETCQQSCQNTYGGYRCYCKHGYRLKSDNRTCTDIDECESKKNYCEKICKNTIGSYRCECPKGFELFSRGLCNDINECTKGLLQCNKRNELCLNTFGSAKCMSKSCEKGYRMNHKTGKCVLMDRTLCFDNSNEISGTCQVPQIFGLTFGALKANSVVPAGGSGLVTFKVDSEKKFSFEFKSIRSSSIGSHSQPVDLSYFSLERSEKSLKLIVLKVMKSIDGPQEIQIEFWVRIIGKHREADGIVGEKVFFVVS